MLIMGSIRIDKTLDIKGISSPRPQELTFNILESMDSGQILQVITSDRAAKNTIPFLCESNGYILIEIEDDGGTIYFTIKK